MKQKRTNWLLLFIITSVLLSGCKYDDGPIWKEIDEIKTELNSLKNQVNSIQTLVDAHEKGHYITEYKSNDNNNGYLITFSNGKTIEVVNGKDTPEVTIEEYKGRYYWVYRNGDDTTDFILDKDGQKVPVTGNDGQDGKNGHTPKVSIDEEGYWTVDGHRIVNESGEPIVAKGEKGDAYFKDVTINNTDGVVTFDLIDGKKIDIPLYVAKRLVIHQPDDKTDYYLIDFGKYLQIEASILGINTIDIKVSAPFGWKVTIYKTYVRVEAPKAKDGVYISGGDLKLTYIDENGLQYVASTRVFAVDFSDPDATFVLSEGNMSDSDGTLNYYDKNGNELRMIYRKVNKKAVGNVLQDMFIYGDRIYLLTQNGSSINGENRFVVCDLKTMKMIYSDPLLFNTPAQEGKKTVHCWPQHIVVTSNTQAFVQWSSSDMESRSGIIELELSDKGVRVKKHLMDTYGDFTKKGATKSRMVYSRGLIFAGLGERLGIIDPITSKVKKIVSTGDRQVKGVAKGANGNIFVVCSGNYEGSQQWGTVYTSNAKVMEIDHEGNIVDDVELPEGLHLPVATWSPAVGLCASFNEPYLYFVDVMDFNAETAARYNYETDQVERAYVTVPNSHVIYGIMGVHPETNDLWVGTSFQYIESTILVCRTDTKFANAYKSFYYPTRHGASPAGVDFSYRFTDEWLNK